MPDGTESTVASQVVGPFLLTALLLDRLRSSAPSRVITMSSGGLYTAALSVDELEMPAASYSGAEQYARAKRAQVTLNEMWAEWFGSEGVPFHALHPGWADTPGIEDAHGQFWLDRRRSIHKLGRTRSSDTPERRQQLWEIVVEVAGLDPATAG